MPRRTRIHIDGLPLQIVQRFHNRAAPFFSVLIFSQDGQYISVSLGRLKHRHPHW
jgi:hypothetical protein